MIKLQIIYITLWSFSQAAYISRMATVNRLRAPTAFRPGVTLHRPWNHPRLVQAASHRAPYVLYRNPPQRYAVKHFTPGVPRNVFAGGPWKTTARLPPMSPINSEYEFVRAASAPPVAHTDGGTGAIHTIPAPNLSLSEKPIVVIDTSETSANTVTSEAPKPTYEVTEKYVETPLYQMKQEPHIEPPIGFSKATSLTGPELQALIQNGASFQLPSEFNFSPISLPHTPIAPSQFTLEGFNAPSAQQELMHTGAERILIQPNGLYQPGILHRIQNPFVQRLPSIDFIPYAAEVQPQSQVHTPSKQKPQLFLLENEQVTKQAPASFVPSENHRSIVQRETQESVVTLIPQVIVVTNSTENEVTSASQPQNVTIELVASESQPVTTTIKYIPESNTEEQNTTPIYFAQIGQGVGNIIANGFYSAINDVRAAAALAQVEKPQETTNEKIENLTATTNSEVKTLLEQNHETDDKNKTIEAPKPILGAPFTKTAESVNVAYTLLRADNKDPKMTQDGAVYAGQIVEATISEDQDFNKEKASILSRRPPLRLVAVQEHESENTNVSIPAKLTVVKAKIPPKSKLTYDDKTGEPVLRIYASYVDSPLQKEIITSKLANIKHTKELETKKRDIVDNWKAATIKSVDKSHGSDANKITQFGIKLKDRSDDYVPLFEDYEE